MNEQYKTGMTEAKNSLSQEETILRSVGNVLQRIREIAGQAGDGALDSNDKKSLASELRQREDELLNLLNSRDASGKYLFSGSQGSVQPFVRNEDGTYSYMGDESQREVQIASSTRIPVSDSGKVLFEDIVNAARLDTKAAAGNTGDGRISVGLVEDEPRQPVPGERRLAIPATVASRSAWSRTSGLRQPVPGEQSACGNRRLQHPLRQRQGVCGLRSEEPASGL